MASPPTQDIITGDEMISDSYDLKEIDGIVYEADCAMIEEGALNISMFHPQHGAHPQAQPRTFGSHAQTVMKSRTDILFSRRHRCQRFR